MNDDYQRMAANAISHEAFCAGQAWQQAAAAHERPCVLWKPRLFIDGDQWCALFGENIQEGVVGFGDSPDGAMWAFDAAWRKKLSPLPGAQNVPKAVAYLDIGAGGYMDIGTDLNDEQLASLPKGRHMLGIVGTYGVDGYVSAQPAPSVPEGWKEGIEAVASMLQKKADDYAEEYGYDDMGGLSFGGGMGGEAKMDYYNNLIELIEEVRAMLAAAPEAKP